MACDIVIRFCLFVVKIRQIWNFATVIDGVKIALIDREKILHLKYSEKQHYKHTYPFKRLSNDRACVCLILNAKRSMCGDSLIGARWIKKEAFTQPEAESWVGKQKSTAWE